MKDIFNLVVYVAITVAAILLLIIMSRMDELPSSLVVGTAIFLVVVLPVVLAVKAGKKEQEAKRIANKSK